MEEIVGIVGAHGFIGTHLVSRSKEVKSQLFCYSGDYTEESIELFLNGEKITTLVYLGGTFDLPFGNLIEKNVLSLERFLRIGVRNSLKKIIFSSTGAIYGAQNKTASKEEDTPHPKSLYGLSKLMAEELLQYFRLQHGLTTVILRFPHVYGPGKKNGVIPDFLSQIRSQKKIVVEGDGSQSRDFLHVIDACDAVLSSINYGVSDTFNISSTDRLTLLELANLFRKKFNCSIEFTAPRIDELQTVHLVNTKACQKLGFTPKKSLQTYIKGLIRT